MACMSGVFFSLTGVCVCRQVGHVSSKQVAYIGCAFYVFMQMGSSNIWKLGRVKAWARVSAHGVGVVDMLRSVTNPSCL